MMDAEVFKKISGVLASIAGNAHVPVYVQEQARAARALMDPEALPDPDLGEDEPDELEEPDEDDDLSLRK